MKKTFSVLRVILTAALVLTLATVSVFADAAVIGTAPSKAVAGNTVTISLNIAEGGTIRGGSIKWNYPADVLECTSAAWDQNILDNATVKNMNLNNKQGVFTLDGSMKVDKFAVFTFTVKEDAPLGDANITFDCTLTDTNNNKTALKTYTAVVTITDHNLVWHYDADGCWQECTDEGCGYATEKIAHTFTAGEEITKAPGCETTGLKTVFCECGYSKEVVIPATGHAYNEEEWSNDATYHWHDCEDCDVPVAKAAHTFVKTVTVEPTAVSKGKAHCVCSVCGFEMDEDIDPLQHDHIYNDEWEIAPEGHSKSCDVCGESIMEGHVFGGWTVIVPATKNAEGLREHSCTICGYQETGVIPKISDTNYPTGPISRDIPGGRVIPKKDSDKTDKIEEIIEIGVDKAQEWINPFKDVAEDDLFYDAVKFVFENNLFIGVSDDEFAPEATMTRAMFVTVLGRMSDVDPDDYTETDFVDVEMDTWYGGYVAWAAENELVLGYGDGTFRPNNTITIEQAAAILMRYAEFKGNDTSAEASLDEFADASQVSDWAVDVMKWIVGEGIYRGMDDGMLKPQEYAPRWLVATMIYVGYVKFA